MNLKWFGKKFADLMTIKYKNDLIRTIGFEGDYNNMPINRTIDIRNVDWPVCILNCKVELDQMKEGEQMEVFVQDIDVVNNLIALIEQLAGHQIENQVENSHNRLIIKKGSINSFRL